MKAINELGVLDELYRSIKLVGVPVVSAITVVKIVVKMNLCMVVIV